MRKNEGKPRLSKAFLFPQAMRALIGVIEWGEKKYTPAKDRGWLNYEADEVMDSLLRHAEAIISGEDTDPESGLPHAAHVVFNAAVYAELKIYYSSSSSGEPIPPVGSI